MIDMKCPICQNNLHEINIVVSTCTNDKCKLWGSSIPNLVLEALTQAKQDLDRARKALEIAVDALKRIKEPTAWGTLYQEQELATEALEQITAEQKELQ